MELGISSFGEIVPDHVAGKAVNAHRRIQDLLEEIKLADEIGLDVYALGEHHRPDYVISAPEVVLAAAAGATRRIRLSSSVTVLSSADPVRTFQNFASLDLASNGRAEIMAGRGSFIESFPLFGYNLDDYNDLFTEKLDLLLNINRNEIVNWQGKHRAPIRNLGVYPRPLQPEIPIWLAVGGTPGSAVRAGKMNLPMTLAILGGQPDQFIPFVNLYRQSAADAGHDPGKLQLAINVHCYLAADPQQAVTEFYPSYETVMNRVGRERGWSPLTRQQFEYLRTSGPLMVGTAEQVAEKIIYMHGLFKNTRFLAQVMNGSIPHSKVMRSIELFGTEVAPIVRKELGA
ncbi:Atu2307/SP_0267 family LLM class monooxygenase [Hufsiella ginkgonis]|uniref:LLM class flavin-dependent oxidoreductase n=1 Tax=Hufsiella ginkgonis TaxID=2695274 RepID=A0A7K1Y1X2_9SPHI|nr:Atu2307/SP_0267 family LLM class monooxygenase [Hufsiella ginkgonis]MXV17078.1 LLM class flavin-dependent oxidoreductase [Hufsiella ginkgonis]